MNKFLPTIILVILAFTLGMGTVYAAKGEACEVVENYLKIQVPQAPENLDAKTTEFPEPTDTSRGKIQN